jgi:hypothetical protein
MILLLISAALSLVLHFETQDGGDIYLRNVEFSELIGFWLRLQPVFDGILIGILFDSQDGGDMFLRNFELSELPGFSLSLPPVSASVLLD